MIMLQYDLKVCVEKKLSLFELSVSVEPNLHQPTPNTGTTPGGRTFSPVRGRMDGLSFGLFRSSWAFSSSSTTVTLSRDSS
jgi:hypothetical protein